MRSQMSVDIQKLGGEQPVEAVDPAASGSDDETGIVDTTLALPDGSGDSERSDSESVGWEAPGDALQDAYVPSNGSPSSAEPKRTE